MRIQKHKSQCYYCGKQSNSMEHVPPQTMFAKKFTCDSITVPSCAAHNTEKSGRDQPIIDALLLPLYNLWKNGEGDTFESDVLVAIRRTAPNFSYTKRSAIDSPLLKDPPEDLRNLPNLAYLVPDIDIMGWIRQVSAALVWNATEAFDHTINWPSTFIWSPTWLSAKGPTTIELNQAESILRKQREIQLSLDNLVWEEGWSAFPNKYPRSIYSFQLHFEPDGKVIFRHNFYSAHVWYNWFSAGEKTVTKLRERLTLRAKKET